MYNCSHVMSLLSLLKPTTLVSSTYGLSNLEVYSSFSESVTASRRADCGCTNDLATTKCHPNDVRTAALPSDSILESDSINAGEYIGNIAFARCTISSRVGSTPLSKAVTSDLICCAMLIAYV